jgi:hypothetical protein
MTRSFKIVTISVAAVALAGLSLYFLFSGERTRVPYPDRTLQLSNAAFLRIHSTLPMGAGDFTWEAFYRDKKDWEKVDDWMVEGQMSWYGGNILACPTGKLVVLARTDGSLVFVRTEAGHWKTFHMEIPEQAPFPVVGVNGTNFTSLETPAIQELRSRMSVDSSQGRIAPSLGQFLPDTRELWIDYLNRESRRFRLHFRISEDGEKLEFLGREEIPFRRATDTSGAPFFFLQPDKRVSALCSKIEFFQ